MRRILLPALAAITVQAAAQSDVQKSDWEIQQEGRDWKESGVKLPAAPKNTDLIEFLVSASSSFRFFIDAKSLSVAADGVVRYTLIARSPSGVDNVSYEGIRCAAGSYRVFAIGNDGRWSVKNTEWRDIQAKSVKRWHTELRRGYFCPRSKPIETAAEGLDALRRGGHPGLPHNN